MEVVQLGIDVTVKAVGHQWYWSYEHTVFSGEVVEVVNMADLSLGDQQLLEVDSSKLIVPFLGVLVTRMYYILLQYQPLLLKWMRSQVN